MKNLVFTIALLFISTNFLVAQIGISAAYSSIHTPGWDEIKTMESIESYGNGYTIGLDYWTRLKNYRVEFLPELSYSRFTLFADDTPPGIQSEMNIFAFALNTQIYLFDIDGDCDCPTWGKEGSFFNKGFYFMLGPGISLVNQQDELTEGFTSSFLSNDSTIRLLLSAGAGFDIGITKSITLTFFGKIKWHSANEWLGLNRFIELSPNPVEYGDTSSVITQFESGLKVQYRWGE